MNEPDFEEHLRSIRPATPRQGLEQRIAQDLAPVPATGVLPVPKSSWLDRVLSAVGWGALGAAIAVVVMLSLKLSGPANTQGQGDAQAAAAGEADMELEHQLLNVADAGVADDEGLVRLLRYESLERRRWTDADGALMIVEVPREDLVRVPVSFQ
jgi:hypothetical protein